MLKIGEFFFKNRDYTPIPFVIILVVLANANQKSLVAGSFLMIFGELIRILGVSHIGGISRTKTDSTGRKLIKTGPFSHVRNPLYIGNLFLSTGLVVTANLGVYFTVGFVMFFLVQYIPIVKWEEQNLRQVFGKEFDHYASSVPRWIPALVPKFKPEEKIAGDYVKAIKSEKNTLIAAIGLYLIILWQSGWLDFVRNLSLTR